jgi:hypothetical protein
LTSHLALASARGGGGLAATRRPARRGRTPPGSIAPLRADDHGGPALTQFAQGFDPFLARHDNVGHDQVVEARQEFSQRVVAVLGDRDNVAGATQSPRDHSADQVFVVAEAAPKAPTGDQPA